MLEKILVALDGSELSDRILIHVRRLLHAADSDVTLLRIVERAIDADDARDHLDQLRDTLISEGARATSRVMVGEPAARIIDAAEEIDPSCIAMSTHGRAGLARAFIGSTCARVLERTRWPVLLANPLGLEHPDSLRFARILVPLDGSKAAADALPLAGELARAHGSELIVLTATGGADEPDAPLAQEWQGAVVRDRLDALAGVPATVRLERGAAVDRILDAVSDAPIDLVVMATSGRGALDRWINGSVSDSIIARCRCPVLIARTGAAAPSFTRSSS